MYLTCMSSSLDFTSPGARLDDPDPACTLPPTSRAILRSWRLLRAFCRRLADFSLHQGGISPEASDGLFEPLRVVTAHAGPR